MNRPQNKTARPRGQRSEDATWFNIHTPIRNEDTGRTSTRVDIYDEIGFWGVTAADFLSALRMVSTNDIDLHLNTPGGEVFDGLAIYNLLDSHPAQVNVYVDSLAASIGSVIAMAGTTIKFAEFSTMMIHEGSGLVIGNSADMAKMAEELDQISQLIAGVYANRAGKTPDYWRDLMRAETWFTSQEAVDAGLGDEVIPAGKRQMPEGAVEIDNRAGVLENINAHWDLSVYINWAGYRERAKEPNQPAIAQDSGLGSVTMTAVPVHHTDTVDKTWDEGPNVKNLPIPIPVSTVKKVYAYYDQSQVDNGEIPKAGCKFPHHQVSADGTPGAANLAACRNGLSRLSSANVPEGDRAGIEKHLRAHMADGEEGQEGPEKEPDNDPDDAKNQLETTAIDGAKPAAVPSAASDSAPVSEPPAAVVMDFAALRRAFGKDAE